MSSALTFNPNNMTKDQITNRLDEIIEEEKSVRAQLNSMGGVTVAEAESGESTRYELHETLNDLRDERISLEKSLGTIAQQEESEGFKGYNYINSNGEKAHSFDFEESIGE